jgi:hypothetical protein
MTRSSRLRWSGALIPLGLLYLHYTTAGSSLANLAHFTEFFRTATWLFVMVLLWELATATTGAGPGHGVPVRRASPSPAGWWALGFGSILALALGLAVWINPHAVFERSDTYPIFPDARGVKQSLYESRQEDVQVVVLGSSRAFTLSPEYIQNRTGLTAFNFSVEGARGVDLALEARLLLRADPDRLPLVLIVEGGHTHGGDDFQSLNIQPLSMLPYMPLEIGLKVALRRTQDVFSLASVSDSLFLLINRHLGPEDAVWTYEADGLGVHVPTASELYYTALERDAAQTRRVFECKQLNPGWMDYMVELASEAEAHGIGVVIFTSPLDGTFYRDVLDNNKAYRTCHRIYLQFIRQLEAEYPNVFFRDLEGQAEIGGLAEAGFYDIQHLKPSASNAVIDALAPEVTEAYEWATQERLLP